MPDTDHPVTTRRDAWYRPADLARRYGVSRQTIWTWRRRGIIPDALQISPNLIGWPPDVIEQWEHERPGAVGKLKEWTA
jgi:predicted DNA-binding transcriptional regulator AlpA